LDETNVWFGAHYQENNILSAADDVALLSLPDCGLLMGVRIILSLRIIFGVRKFLFIGFAIG